LKLLVLACQHLDGELPAELAQLPNLQQLHLQHNQFSGNLPMSWKDLNNLRTLDLSYNKLSGAVSKELLGAGMTSLRALIMSHNAELAGCIPKALSSRLNQKGSGFTQDDIASATKMTGFCDER